MDELNSKMEQTEKRIYEPEDRMTEITQSEQQRKQTDKKQSLRNLWVCNKNLIFVSLESQKSQAGRTEKVLEEIMAENLANLAGDISLQIKEAK